MKAVAVVDLLPRGQSAAAKVLALREPAQGGLPRRRESPFLRCEPEQLLPQKPGRGQAAPGRVDADLALDLLVKHHGHVASHRGPPMPT